LVIFDHVFYHLLGYTQNIGDPSFFWKVKNPFLTWGNYGVAIFLFISGFGITSSYIKKGIKNRWLFKHYLRIWLPYILITVVWLIMDHFLLHLHHGKNEILLSIIPFPIDDSWQVVDFNMWFIPFLLFQYFVFFFVFKTKLLSNMTKLCLFAGIISVVSYFHNIYLLRSIPTPTTQWPMNYVLYFPIGIFIGMYYKQISFMISKLKTKSVVFMIVSFMLIALTQSKFLNDSAFWGGVFFILIVFLLNSLGYFSRFLYWIGLISFEVYLVHGPLMYRYDFILYKGPIYLTFPIYFSVILFLAFLLRYVSSKILIYLSIENSSSVFLKLFPFKRNEEKNSF